MRKEDQWNKQGEHAITEDGSHRIEAYKLPITDQDTERRNFKGYDKAEVYTLEDMRKGDSSGTTETDSKTDPKGSGGYTKINQKHGKAHSSK
jgi:hypothetical protein